MSWLNSVKKPIPHIIPDLNQVTHKQLKYLQRCKPMVCTPVRGGIFMGNYHLSMVSLSRYAAKLGVEIDFQVLMGCSYIEQGRNVLANTFWKSDCTHLVFVDADNGFITNNFFELLLTQLDIVGGCYTKRVINWKAVEAAHKAGVPSNMLAHCSGDFPMHMREDHPVVINHEPQRVLTMPTGFLCISRRTFETYVKAHPTRKTTEGNPGHYGIQFFKAGTITCDDGSRGFDSEDNIFCKDMLKLGIETYLCPWMHITHYGEYNFEACLPCSMGAYVHLPGWAEKNAK